MWIGKKRHYHVIERPSLQLLDLTRMQAVTRIADRTASQQTV